MSIQKDAFKSILNHLATKQGSCWNMTFEASQFDLKDFEDSVSYGHITLNLSMRATSAMQLFDDHIYFKVRKHGIEQELSIPYTALMVIHDPDNNGPATEWPYFVAGARFEPKPEVNPGAIHAMTVPNNQSSPTLLERIEVRGWKVIQGSIKSEVMAPQPFIKELHQAKLNNRNKTKIKIEQSKSIFFPDLDVSKCVFHTKKKLRPEWLTVIKGGLDACN